MQLCIYKSVDAIALIYLYKYFLYVYLLSVEKKLVQNDRDWVNLRDAIFSYMTQDANLIYLTCRVGHRLVDIYRVGRLTLS